MPDQAPLPTPVPIQVTDSSFTLNTRASSYTFHVDIPTGDLRTDHFGAAVHGPIPVDPEPLVDGWTGMPDRVRREFPDQGRGDFRVPAFRITQGQDGGQGHGHTTSAFKYKSYEIVGGKELDAFTSGSGLPGTFGSASDATTLIVYLEDKIGQLEAQLRYTVFPAYDAIVRSARIVNWSPHGKNVTVDSLSSLALDFPYEESGLEMVSLRGDWAREARRVRRGVEYGIQSIGSTTGFSSHLHNPFVALVRPSTTEVHGDAWGFSLVYSGSFSIAVEKASQGLVRVVAGPNALGWTLRPGESIDSPECVAVYSSNGVGGMSRSLHGLYRRHLMKSRFATAERPVLLNSWEGMYFNIDEARMVRLAEEAAALDVKLLVMDDGWFGDKYPRTSDAAGLGDWVPNPARFPEGLGPLVDKITALKVAGSSDTKMRFGIWVEPEMVNPQSTLYEEHPDWVLHAGSYPRTEQRNQLVLNLGLTKVQEFIINAISTLLSTSNGSITYVKWDHNRGLAETPSPSANHAYMLGMYRVFDVLTSRFPNVLWEGCASGGGRYDPGILQFFPQVWASDDSDAVERIHIQFGSSLVYPPSSMGGHISSVPNHQTGRSTPLTFRAHVAMMCGSFGLELNPSDLTAAEREAIPGLIALAEKVNPIVLKGDMWRLNLPEESNWPAALFLSETREKGVLFVFQLEPWVNHALARVRLQGLEGDAMYRVDGGVYGGSMLMNLGLQYSFRGHYGSRVVFIERAIAQ